MTGAIDGTDTRARIVDEICDRIIAGESVAAIFREPSADFPGYTTFWRWLRNDDALNARVLEAQRIACLALEDRLVDVTRETRVGEIVTVGPKGREVKTVDMVDRSRLEADALKWVLSKRYPKRYGDRTVIAGDAENPLHFVDDTAVASKLLPELAARGTSTTPGEPDQT